MISQHNSKKESKDSCLPAWFKYCIRLCIILPVTPRLVHMLPTAIYNFSETKTERPYWFLLLQLVAVWRHLPAQFVDFVGGVNFRLSGSDSCT